MTRTDADLCRATGISPVRPMSPFEPLPPPRPPGHRVLAAPLRSHGASSSRSSCSAPLAALLTCWRRDKRELRRRTHRGLRLPVLDEFARKLWRAHAEDQIEDAKAGRP